MKPLGKNLNRKRERERARDQRSLYSALTSDKKEKRFEAIAHLLPGNRTPVNEHPLSLNQSLFDQFYETLPTPPGEIDYRSYLGFLLILKKKRKKK